MRAVDPASMSMSFIKRMRYGNGAAKHAASALGRLPMETGLLTARMKVRRQVVEDHDATYFDGSGGRQPPLIRQVCACGSRRRLVSSWKRVRAVMDAQVGTFPAARADAE